MQSNKDVTIIDVREADEFNACAIPGAVNMPLSRFDSKEIENLPTSKVVIHCQSGNRAKTACKKITNTTKDIYQFTGGIEEWKHHGGDIICRKAVRFTIMQQVQIIAGGCVLVGVILSKVHNPYWVYLSGFMGAGLLFAGLSGWCGMAKLLAKMPWNKVK